MIPLIHPAYGLKDLLASTFSKTNNPQQKIAQQYNKKYGYFVPQARDALFEILKHIKIKKHQEVLLPAYICDIVPKVIQTVAKPVYIDIIPKKLTIDIDDLKNKITKNTKAIIVPHLFGFVNDLETIQKICKQNNLILIEDCAQALYAHNKDTIAGSVGQYTILSLRFSKDTTMLTGGIALSNHELDITYPKKSEFRSFIQLAVTHLALKSQWFFYAKLYYHFKNKALIPKVKKTVFNKNNPGPAPSLIEQNLVVRIIKNLPNQIKVKQKVRKIYEEFFTQNNIAFQPNGLMRMNIFTKNQKQTIRYLMSKGIEADYIWNYTMSNACKNSKEAAKKIVNLPIHHKLTRKQVKYICKIIKITPM